MVGSITVTALSCGVRTWQGCENLTCSHHPVERGISGGMWHDSFHLIKLIRIHFADKHNPIKWSAVVEGYARRARAFNGAALSALVGLREIPRSSPSAFKAS